MKRLGVIFVCALMVMGSWKCTTFSAKKPHTVNAYGETLQTFVNQPAVKVLFGWGMPRIIGRNKKTKQLVWVYVISTRRYPTNRREKMPPTPIGEPINPDLNPSGTYIEHTILYFFLKKKRGQLFIDRVAMEVVRE